MWLRIVGVRFTHAQARMHKLVGIMMYMGEGSWIVEAGWDKGILDLFGI